MKILVIDNYDSFTYNLVQLIGKFTQQITVIRNDRATLDDIRNMKPDRILISPGPGVPEDSKISLEVIHHLGETIPILGICMGHQGIGISFGGKVVNAPTLMHGKSSNIHHDSRTIFSNVPQDFIAARYHSLVIDRNTMPDVLEISAETDNGVIMGVRHKHFPIEGLQFHPESILSTEGEHIIKNWVAL
ncbi:MAG: aminodeoxychorismate/anthranilate synthase component II [Calditrichia bacterium]|nr:aminodeoxychorismate/anthranilate synthase component II [Calditrichia bacterium]